MLKITGILTLASLALLPAGDELKKGPVKLKKARFGKGAFEVSVGKVVKGTCQFYIDEFFGKKIINAGVRLHNTSKSAMHCHYYVAFFNAEGDLLGSASQGTMGEGLAADEKTQLGSCLIPLPVGTHEKVTHYQVRFFESPKPIGKG